MSEKYERKPFMYNLSLENARMFFRVQTKLVQTLRKNFPTMYRRMGQPLTCPSCSTRTLSEVTSDNSETHSSPPHSQSHILESCEAVEDLRTECDPDDNRSLAEYF